VRAK
jgi:hypothetical protein